ncbi:MMPL family transporter [Corynebacterium epidermidicanis]|nr:MMPL family transporter [Corynebacterium epidermidicanis]
MSGIWLVLFGVLLTVVLSSPISFSSDFTLPQLPATQTRAKMDERFPPVGPSASTSTAQVIIQVPEGETLADPDHAQRIAQLIAALRELPGITKDAPINTPQERANELRERVFREEKQYGLPSSVIEGDFRNISPVNNANDTGIFEITLDLGPDGKVPDEVVDKAADTLAQFNSPEFAVGYSGGPFSDGDTAQQFNMESEAIGLLIAALVITVTLGSLLAAGIPLTTAVFGILLSIAGIALAARHTASVNFLAPTFSIMLGLAVGIDYSLFVLARFRSELVRKTGYDISPRERAEHLRELPKAAFADAMGIAVSTAGRSIIFAGATVVVALASLCVFRISFLSGLALTAASTVAISVAIALTFLPAVTAWCGRKTFSRPLPIFRAPDPEDERPTFGLRWVRAIRKHPALFLIPAVLFLALCALPARDMQVAMPTDSTAPLGTPTRTAADMIERGFGPGRNYPMVALVDLAEVPQDQRKQTILQVGSKIRKIDGVQHVQAVRGTDTLDTVELLVTTKYSATDPRAASIVHRLRENAEQVEASTNASYGVTSMTAVFVDLTILLKQALIPYLAIVLALAFVLLGIMFRSLWIPLIATIGFLLSMSATFGITVALFQHGAFGLVSDPQPLISFLPIILVGLVFGLAMDYQVFLVSRMREGWDFGKTAGNAVANGFKHSVRVVTAAALIMVGVFSSFLLHDVAFIKTMSFALATAILLDAFLVRMTILPAVMFLLDEQVWKIPFRSSR